VRWEWERERESELPPAGWEAEGRGWRSLRLAEAMIQPGPADGKMSGDLRNQKADAWTQEAEAREEEGGGR
jgi:hypothetical protein